jgi:hypothetical protein
VMRVNKVKRERERAVLLIRVIRVIRVAINVCVSLCEYVSR